MSNKKDKSIYTREFLDKVKNEDNDAIGILYEKARKISYDKAFSILKNHHDAEDVAMGSFIKALDKLDTLRNPNDFPSWLRKITENKAKDFIKKNSMIYVDDSVDDYSNDDVDGRKTFNPVKIAESNENIDLYKKLLKILSKEQSTALILNKIEGYKIREIAEMLGCAESTVKYRLARGEKKLSLEADKLKKKGYTLNGMTAIDFFTMMSKALGVTSYNFTALLGITVANTISMKVVASIVAITLLTFSGIIGCNVLYGDPLITKMPDVKENTVLNRQTDSLSNKEPNSQPTVEATSNPKTQNTSAPVVVPVSNPNVQPVTVPQTNVIPEPVINNQQGNADNVPVVTTGNNSNPQANIIPVTAPTNTTYVNTEPNIMTVPSSVFQPTITSSSLYSTTGATTEPINVPSIYGDLSTDDVTYLKTLLAYGTHYPSDNYLNLSDNGISNILNSRDDVLNNYYDSITLFSSKNVWSENGNRFLKVSESDLKEFSLKAFGVDISNNKSFNDTYLKDGSYLLNSTGDNGLKKELDIEGVEFTADKNQMTMHYICNGIEHVAVFRKNNSTSYPFALVSNLPLKGQYMLSDHYDNFGYYVGETIDCDDFTIKIYQNWAYKIEENDVIIYDSLDSMNNNDTSSIVLFIKRYNGWSDEIAANKDLNFYGMKNNIYYYYQFNNLNYGNFSDNVAHSFKLK